MMYYKRWFSARLVKLQYKECPFWGANGKALLTLLPCCLRLHKYQTVLNTVVFCQVLLMFINIKKWRHLAEGGIFGPLPSKGHQLDTHTCPLEGWWS